MSISSNTVVIAISRNTRRGASLPSIDWGDFKDRVLQALVKAEATVVSRPIGLNVGQIGEWNGKREESAIYIALVRQDILPWLREQLQFLRLTYDQGAAAGSHPGEVGFLI